MPGLVLHGAVDQVRDAGRVSHTMGVAEEGVSHVSGQAVQRRLVPAGGVLPVAEGVAEFREAVGDLAGARHRGQLVQRAVDEAPGDVVGVVEDGEVVERRRTDRGWVLLAGGDTEGVSVVADGEGARPQVGVEQPQPEGAQRPHRHTGQVQPLPVDAVASADVGQHVEDIPLRLFLVVPALTVGQRGDDERAPRLRQILEAGPGGDEEGLVIAVEAVEQHDQRVVALWVVGGGHIGGVGLERAAVDAGVGPLVVLRLVGDPLTEIDGWRVQPHHRPPAQRGLVLTPLAELLSVHLAHGEGAGGDELRLALIQPAVEDAADWLLNEGEVHHRRPPDAGPRARRRRDPPCSSREGPARDPRLEGVFCEVHARLHGSPVQRGRHAVHPDAVDLKHVLEPRPGAPPGGRVGIGVDGECDNCCPRLDKRLQAEEHIVPAVVGGEAQLDEVGGVPAVGRVTRIGVVAVAVGTGVVAQAGVDLLQSDRFAIGHGVCAGVVKGGVTIDKFALTVPAQAGDVRRIARPGVTEPSGRL